MEDASQYAALPALVFATLYAYPFLEQLLSFDVHSHNVLRLPYQRPFGTAFGCAVIMMMLVLQFAAGDDIISIITGNSVVAVRAILRMLFFVAPAVTGILVYVLCARAQRRTARSRASLQAPSQANEAWSDDGLRQ